MAKKVSARKPTGQPHIRSREIRPESTKQQHLIFCLRYLANDFRVADCQRDDKAAFADRLAELSQLTWNQLLLAPRQGLGSEVIAKESMRVPIPARITPDVRLLAFRFGSGARIIGYREDAVLRIVWIDPYHRAYSG